MDNTHTNHNLEVIFDYIEELCGIALDSSKAYLIDARLGPLIKQHGAKSAVDLVEKAKLFNGEPIRRSLVEAMTTRETFFFRDNSPFEALQFKALPELIDEKMKEGKRSLRIWSAAASTGQEACSIGMVLHEMIPDLNQWDIQILATDISEDALERGRQGRYTKLEVERGLPIPYVNKYFGVSKEGYQVVDSVHRLIRFRQLNLLHPFSFREQFDIIFCRNVAIYFEKNVKIDLFRRMLPLLPRYGYLFVGVSESLFDCGPEFKALFHCKSTFYQPNMPIQKGTESSLRPTESILPKNHLPIGSTSPLAARPANPIQTPRPVSPAATIPRRSN